MPTSTAPLASAASASRPLAHSDDDQGDAAGGAARILSFGSCHRWVLSRQVGVGVGAPGLAKWRPGVGAGCVYVRLQNALTSNWKNRGPPAFGNEPESRFTISTACRLPSPLEKAYVM